VIDLLRIAVSLAPVFVFLAGLVVLDSFKLVRIHSVVQTIAVGCGVAAAALLLNGPLQKALVIGPAPYSRYVAPLTEEFLKALPVIYVVSRKKVGFMVDAAIYGFAVGAGFAFVENIYYLRSLQDPNLFTWIIRGFGTAVMHGGTTAIFAVLSKTFTDRHSGAPVIMFLPGLVIAASVHSFFNHFLLPPLVNTITQLIALPVLIMITYTQSEKMLRDWLEVGLDSDVRLLESITTGMISQTRVGTYLYSLRERFPGEVVADMLCFLRVHLELAIRAKGILLMREAGFQVPADPEICERLTELRFLEKSIGKTGRLALSPILRTSSRDLWQLCLLDHRI
jgi:RsiW-degrading membrane proteinase PrsW (M82 family)